MNISRRDVLAVASGAILGILSFLAAFLVAGWTVCGGDEPVPDGYTAHGIACIDTGIGLRPILAAALLATAMVAIGFLMRFFAPSGGLGLSVGAITLSVIAFGLTAFIGGNIYTLKVVAWLAVPAIFLAIVGARLGQRGIA